MSEVIDKINAAIQQSGATGNAASLDDVYAALKEGPRSIMLWILENYYVATKKEIGTDKEEMYVYDKGFYLRGEEFLREVTYQRYIDQWKNALHIIEELWTSVDKSNSQEVEKLATLTGTLKDTLKKGPSKPKIDETLAQLRVQTFREASDFNPSSHIPFRNGLLRLSDWKLVPHTPELIYLWRVEGSLLEDRLKNISLNDCPTYKKFLLDSFETWDIPMLLQYGGYAFYPSFPRQMVLWIVGRPRVGKGTNARIWKHLNPAGYGAISFEKLTIAENRFVFQGIAGKNLLVDPEVKRVFKKGAKPDYGNFNKLFGGDTVDLEKKGKQPEESESRAKGLFIANLPLPKIDSEPLLSRVLLIKSRDRNISKEERIANLDSKIVQAERDQIVTLFIRYLRVLKDHNWNFISELSTDATMEIWDLFSDAIQFYLDEMISYQGGSEIKCDDMYDSFTEWCKGKGIPVISSMTFKKSVGYVYRKTKRGPRKSRYYVFLNCAFSDENEIEVGHHSNSQETRNIRASYYRYRECPALVLSLDMKREKEKHDIIIEPKLDSEIFAQKNALNKAPGVIQPVSNLYRESDSVQDENKYEIQENPTNSDVQSEHSKTYRYLVMKDFPLYGHVYQPGIEFEHTIYFDNELQSGILKLVEDRKERFRDALDRAKAEWKENPRKALFDFVEKEAPETKFHSLTPKAILDMLPVPDVDLSTIYELCEELTKEGAFLKNKAGAYSVNAEFVNGGIRDFFKAGD